jgi:hypothetical protein
MAKRLVLPRAHAMVLCDDFEQSSNEDGVFHLYGVRSRIHVDVFPYTHPQLCVYLQLTGHRGTTRCRVAVVDRETDEEILVAPTQVINLTGPLDVVATVSRWKIVNGQGQGYIMFRACATISWFANGHCW